MNYPRLLLERTVIDLMTREALSIFINWRLERRQSNRIQIAMKYCEELKELSDTLLAKSFVKTTSSDKVKETKERYKKLYWEVLLIIRSTNNELNNTTDDDLVNK